MAAEPRPDWLLCLPSAWTYGALRDGRIFFINEQAQSTTWLHPVSGEAVVTGHRKTQDLPKGWEEGYTFEGARCFINHNERKVTCKHPLNGAPSQDNCIFVVNEQPAAPPPPEGDKRERPTSLLSETSHTLGSDHSPATSVSTATSPCPGTNSGGSRVSGSGANARPSRSSKKLHNFGKRSNSIKRNVNAPVIKRGWLYKQDSTGMKLWKKRWFVLCDMCLFYYRDDKEDNVLGSILLPSFHISMLSVDDHISRKYAFKATHSNMRTYYFCSDSAKDSESWMQVMTDAALVHVEPLRRSAAERLLDKVNADMRTSEELNNQHNQRALTCPEIQNNQRNRDPEHLPPCPRGEERLPPCPREEDRHPDRPCPRGEDRHPDRPCPRGEERHPDRPCPRGEERHPDRPCPRGEERHPDRPCPRGEERHPDRPCPRGEERYPDRLPDCYTLHRDGDSLLVKKDGVSYMLQKDGDKYILHKDGEQFTLRKNGEKYSLQKDEPCALHKNSTVKNHMRKGSAAEDYCQGKDMPKLLPVRDTPAYATHTLPAQHIEGHRYVPAKEVRRQLSLRETDRSMFGNNKYGTIHVVDRYGTLKEVKKYATLREGDRYATLRDVDMYSLRRDSSTDRAKLSIQLQPAQTTRHNQNINGSSDAVDQPDGSSRLLHTPTTDTVPAPPKTGLSRTQSMPPMEPWARPYRAKADADTVYRAKADADMMYRAKADADTMSISSYQTLPRNMPSHRSQIVPRCPEGYRTLPRNSLCRPESVCAAGSTDKRRSIKDDTMWQLYEWQQRQAFSRLSMAPPTGVGHYGTLPSSKTMSHLRENMSTPLPPSPSHGSLYSTLPPPRLQGALSPGSPHSELSSPVLRDSTLGRQKTLPLKAGLSERVSAAGLTPHDITPQSLQGKTSEELTLLLIKLRRQQAELSSLREHTLAQLRALGSEGPNAKTDVLSHHLQRSLRYLDSQKKDNEPLIFMIHTMIENSAPRPQLYQHIIPEKLKTPTSEEEPDIDTKLSRLCEQDKVVRTQEEKVQQLHREKHTLETALLSASQELSEHSHHTAHTQSLLQQRDVLQGGLLSTCRELNRTTQELLGSRQEYQRLEADVGQAKSRLLQQLEALGSPQTEPPSQRHIQIQKELWRIQDVMEALAKNKPPPGDGTQGFPSSKPLSSINKNETAPVLPPQEGESAPPRPPLVPPRPPLPHHYPHPPSAAGSRSGTPSGPDYRLYKSEPELTTVKEEEPDEERGGGATERREVPVSKVSPCPVGIVPPRTKSTMSPISPISPPESSTIASYVTLRKKKPQPRAERPHSALDPAGGFGERGETGRIRMSVEEQLERMRRNQEACTLRRNKLSRSASFNRDHSPGPGTQQSAPQTDCTDPCGLEAALQRLKDVTASLTEAPPPEQVAPSEEESTEKAPEVTESKDTQECERQTAVILEVSAQTVKVVELQPFEDLSSSANSPSDSTSLQTPEPQWSPVGEESRDVSQDDLRLNNLLPAQSMTLMSSDT